jgi:hypothetical protein
MMVGGRHAQAALPPGYDPVPTVHGVSVKCQRCDVALCVDRKCFLDYHTKTLNWTSLHNQNFACEKFAVKCGGSIMRVCVQ